MTMTDSPSVTASLEAGVEAYEELLRVYLGLLQAWLRAQGDDRSAFDAALSVLGESVVLLDVARRAVGLVTAAIAELGPEGL